MTGGIFISYRRDDAKHAAGRLVDRLGQTFSRNQLFLDIDNIEPGLDFVKVLSQQVQACDVLLAVIGPGWLDNRDKSGARRLDNPKDFVRIEIEAALARDIRVIPVLVDGAQMPSEQELPVSLHPLLVRHAVRLVHERFSSDAEDLTRALAKVVTPAKKGGWFAGMGLAHAKPQQAHPAISAPGQAAPLQTAMAAVSGASNLSAAPGRSLGAVIKRISAVQIFAGLGALSGIASVVLTGMLPNLEIYFNIWPGIFFAGALLAAMALSTGVGWWRSLMIIAGTQVGWQLAVIAGTMAIGFFKNDLGMSDKLYMLPGGIVAGGIGAFITWLSLALIEPRLMNRQMAIRVTGIGTALGALLWVNGLILDNSVINGFILYVPWQAGVAAALGARFGLSNEVR